MTFEASSVEVTGSLGKGPFRGVMGTKPRWSVLQKEWEHVKR